MYSYRFLHSNCLVVSISENAQCVPRDALDVFQQTFGSATRQTESALTYLDSNVLEVVGKLGYFVKMPEFEEIAPRVRVSFTAENGATFPQKKSCADAGYDISAREKLPAREGWSPKVALYSTGIRVSIQNGYYLEMVPRSSLSKSGYMLANGVGIIDSNFAGEILIPLIRIDEDAPEPTLPFRCCQLIVRRQYQIEHTRTEAITATGRGAGGFGSTGD